MGVAYIRALTIAALSVIAAATAFAHETGTTRVFARFAKDATYQIDVVTGPNSLLSKIEHHRTFLPPALARARLRSHARDLSAAAEIRFGGMRVSPRVEVLDDDTVRFSGDIPPNVGRFTWRWRLTYSGYALLMPSGTVLLDSDAVSPPYRLGNEVLPPGRLGVARQYLRLGYTHLIPYGLDLILFILGIFLLATGLRGLLLQVAAFTVAYSITLALSIYGVLPVSPRIVEPLIAVSIAWVAIENLMTAKLRPRRLGVIFLFGLIHGLGLAAALRDFGLPHTQVLTALLSFNAGVEMAQLTILAAAFGLIAHGHHARPWYRHRLMLPASAAISAAGIFWTIQRTLM